MSKPRQFRIFTGFFFDEKSRNILSKHQKILAKKPLAHCLRWVDPVRFHLTGIFFGNLDKNRLEDLFGIHQKLLDNLKLESQFATDIPIKIDATKYFGRKTKPRVFFVRVNEYPPIIQEYVKMLHLKCKQEGFDLDDREYRPHITLAYVKQKLDSSELVQLTGIFCGKTNASLKLHHPVLIQSYQAKDGLRYQTLTSSKDIIE